MNDLRIKRYKARRKRERQYGIAILLVAVFLIASVLLRHADGVFASRSLEQMEDEGTPVHVADYVDEDELFLEIARVTEPAKGTFGVYLKVLETGESVEIRSSEEFFAASCYKIPLVLMLYEMAASGNVDLGEKVAYTPEDRETGTGVLIGSEFGSTYSLRRLAELAIVKSDNVAANMLLRRIGKQAFVDYQRSAGVSVVPETVNNSSPSDLGIFLERLYRFCEANEDLGDELMGYFLDSDFKDRLPAMLPRDAKVANKIGTWPGSVNDAGIIAEGPVQYVIAVMSRDVASTEDASEVIATISRRVYDHISKAG